MSNDHSDPSPELLREARELCGCFVCVNDRDMDGACPNGVRIAERLADHERRGAAAERVRTLRSASHLLRNAAAAIAAKGTGDAEAKGAAGALDSWATSFEALAAAPAVPDPSTEPVVPRTYEQGWGDAMREAARRLRTEAYERRTWSDQGELQAVALTSVDSERG